MKNADLSVYKKLHVGGNEFMSENELFYNKDVFYNRLNDAMLKSNLDWEQLSNKFKADGYSITAANLKTYVTQRNVSLKVLLFLSKALGISMDYLIGNDKNSSLVLKEGFDYEFSGQRYNQYAGKFYVYFYPTRTNEPEEIIVAQLTIDAGNNYEAILQIPIVNADPKTFSGRLILSQKTDTAFLNMTCCNGEMLQITFNDPNTFQNKIRCCIAALVSVSSGDSKRMPTLSRAVITEKKLTTSGMEFLSANLRMNSKYINIEKEKLCLILEEFCKDENIRDYDEICQRVTTAFKPRICYFLEEQYFLNTFRIENSLSNLQIERLVATMRNNSISSINYKIPRSIDARLYLLLKQEDMFINE